METDTDNSLYNLPRVQKVRIEALLRLVVAECERELRLQSVGAHEGLVRRARQDYLRVRSEFDQLVTLRGLRPGDRIRITRSGPLNGCEGIFKEVAHGAFLMVDWPEGSPCLKSPLVVPSAEEVEFVPWLAGVSG